MAEPQAKEPARRETTGWPALVAIEVGDDKNRNFIWSPTKENLRGWWKRVNLRGCDLNPEVEQIPDIPGYFVEVDARNKVGRIYDPLRRPENKDECEKLARILKTTFNIVEGPGPESVYKSLNEHHLKTWLYQMRVMVDQQKAMVRKGDLPSMEEIRHLPGEIIVQAFNNSARKIKGMTELIKELTGETVSA